jgi:hypothetical protein
MLTTRLSAFYFRSPERVKYTPYCSRAGRSPRSLPASQDGGYGADDYRCTHADRDARAELIALRPWILGIGAWHYFGDLHRAHGRRPIEPEVGRLRNTAAIGPALRVCRWPEWGQGHDEPPLTPTRGILVIAPVSKKRPRLRWHHRPGIKPFPAGKQNVGPGQRHTPMATFLCEPKKKSAGVTGRSRLAERDYWAPIFSLALSIK